MADQSRWAYSHAASGSLAYSNNVAAGATLIAVAHCYSGWTAEGGSITSDNGNSWVRIRVYNVVSHWMDVWYCFNANAGATTVSWVCDTSTFISFAIYEKDGLLTTDPLDRNPAGTDGSSTTPASLASGTTTQATEWLFGATSINTPSGSTTITKDADYDELQKAEDGDSFFTFQDQKRDVTSTLSDTSNLTLGTSRAWIAHISTFKVASAAGSASISPSASLSPSVSVSPSVSPSISQSASISQSRSVSPSISVSPSVSPSLSASPSISASPSVSASVSPSVSPSVSLSISQSPSVSRSLSASPSVSLSLSKSPSVSASVSPSTPATIVGSVCWGHVTGVVEDNVRTFASNWSGTGAIENSGDTERLALEPGEYMESEVDETDIKTVELLQNNYAAGDTVLMRYRHGASEVDCLAASWINYTVPFVSLGFVQVRMESTL